MNFVLNMMAFQLKRWILFVLQQAAEGTAAALAEQVDLA